MCEGDAVAVPAIGNGRSGRDEAGVGEDGWLIISRLSASSGVRMLAKSDESDESHKSCMLAVRRRRRLLRLLEI